MLFSVLTVCTFLTVLPNQAILMHDCVHFGEHICFLCKKTYKTKLLLTDRKRAQTSKLSFHRHHHCQIMLFPTPNNTKETKQKTQHNHAFTTKQLHRTLSSMFPSLLFMLPTLQKRGEFQGFFDLVKGVYRKERPRLNRTNPSVKADRSKGRN